MSLFFRFSGILSNGSGCDYTFPQNPETMSEITPKSKHSILQTLLGENIYHRSLVDNEVRQMDWSTTSYDVYSGLKRFAERDVYGNPPTISFWDGEVYDFQGAQIEVIDVHGTPIASNYNNWKVNLQFKWVE